MHRGRPIGEAFDHRSPGGIGQSRKCCTQSIHNHMVVDFPNVSRINFATPDLCFLSPPSYSPSAEAKTAENKTKTAPHSQHRAPRKTLLLDYCLGVPPESRIIGICEASCTSINITSRRSNWKKTAVFLPGMTLLKSEMYLCRNSATD